MSRTQPAAADENSLLRIDSVLCSEHMLSLNTLFRLLMNVAMGTIRSSRHKTNKTAAVTAASCMAICCRARSARR